MGFEVEVKYRGVDHGDLGRRLAAMGAGEAPAVSQEDVYLAHPSRDFALSGEAFRIRREGDANYLTYKGPKLGGTTKTREEVEVGFAAGPAAFGDLSRLAEALGFRPVAAIRKSRRSFVVREGGRELHVALDAAEGLGDFAEVEAIAADEAGLAEAQAAVLRLAAALGLAEVEPRSYLRMHLERAGRS